MSELINIFIGIGVILIFVVCAFTFQHFYFKNKYKKFANCVVSE